MNARLQAYRTRLDSMALRERVLIFLMLAGVLVALTLSSALDPLLLQQKQLAQKLTQSQAQTEALEAQMRALTDAAKIDPDAPNKRQLAQLEAQGQQMHAALANARQGLVPADRMTQMLQELLGSNRHLKLLEIKTLPAAALLPAAKNTTEPAPTQPLGLYRHTVEISVEGSYSDLLVYLAALEHLPWRVYWSAAHLSTQTYPSARLKLTLFTLSLDQTWLSV